jgi:hypothetical protein
MEARGTLTHPSRITAIGGTGEKDGKDENQDEDANMIKKPRGHGEACLILS